MPKRISRTKVPIRFVIVTLDSHLATAAHEAAAKLRKVVPGLELTLHAAAEWNEPDALARCREDIARGHIIVVTQLFMDEHIRPVLDVLKARREQCDAMVGCMSAAQVVQLTRLGQFRMGAKQGGPMALIKRLRGKSDKPGAAGARQMTMLRRLPKILRFIPGTAQDLRAYFLTLQYWLAGSEENMQGLVSFLVSRYATKERALARSALPELPPVDYPEVGYYHPDHGLTAQLKAKRSRNGTVGLIVMRSYLLAGNTDHYDGVIRALEARGLRVITVFASGLDARPAIEKGLMVKGRCRVDALVSLTGFPLVGGPAYNDTEAAQAVLARLDVPFIAAHPLEFQTLEEWGRSAQGLTPIEATMMVALPELDGATGALVFGGRSGADGRGQDMHSQPERAAVLAARVHKLIALRRKERGERKIAIVLFNFPPNGGSTGTAAHLAVFESLYNVLQRLAAEGYRVQPPSSVEELRARILHGNSGRFGTDANVHARIATDDHVAKEPWLGEIEAAWGPAPGKELTDGTHLLVLGAEFGDVFVGVQPGFGYEGDPMRLLFEGSFAPTHAFAAFYRYLREDFGADAVLHFGTHGALEFMPGKQVGMSESCWPDRLIGDLPNLYLYAANNPSEGTLAKRRSGATLISYLTPSVTQAGVYKELQALKSSIEHWRSLPPDTDEDERKSLAGLIETQAGELELASAPSGDLDARIAHVRQALQEYETALIPHGLHVVGDSPDAAERGDLLGAMAQADGVVLPDNVVAEIAANAPLAAAEAAVQTEQARAACGRLVEANARLQEEHELPAIVRALDGRFIAPVPGGDVLHNPDVLPTGRNLHGFDPFKLPSRYALLQGKQAADRLIARHVAEGFSLPESLAMVLWGTDNLKSEGAPLGQALALLGAQPLFDGYGKLSGAELIPLEELGRPRIDVVMTLSGIFRDLLPLQTKLLADACFLAASAEEPPELNFVRKHSLAYQQAHDCGLETAALRVFGNAEGAYGANVNHLIEDGAWEDGDELGDAFTTRKCFAYGRAGAPVRQPELMQSALGDVQLAFQNLESVELGVTTLDHYFDGLGGINRAVSKARGEMVPVYISDQTAGEGKVRTLNEQVALETRTRMLNPKWYESMLQHGYEGVRQIESHVTNTLGWSATTGQVSPWVYQSITETYILDDEMRTRLSELNPTASAKVANRLLEAHERDYWVPDEATLEALKDASAELEDRMEGIVRGAVA